VKLSADQAADPRVGGLFRIQTGVVRSADGFSMSALQG